MMHMILTRTPKSLLLGATLALGLSACGGDDGPDNTGGSTGGSTELQIPKTYSFDSRFVDGKSSVVTSGQAFRHVLIREMMMTIMKLPTDGSLTKDQVVARLNAVFEFDYAANKDKAPKVKASLPLAQATYEDISGSEKDLRGKLAGNDEEGPHKDWNTEGVVGWELAGKQPSPTDLLQHWFNELGELVAAGQEGSRPIFVSKQGIHYGHLIHKFLLGGVAYSQASDDYLDDDLDGKGLNSDNTKAKKEGAVNTKLESAWDEGFGYFGAARDYGLYKDAEIAGKGGRAGWDKGDHDTNSDGKIDVVTEMNWPSAACGAKRDLGSREGAKTDFTQQAWDAFLKGRAIIAAADGALSEAQMTELKKQRDIAMGTWETIIAADMVHAINHMLEFMAHFDADDYKLPEHAKVWSACKSFAIDLQFNPRSKIKGDDLKTLHEKLGTHPVLKGATDEEKTAYAKGLREARKLLADTYGFDPKNVGDDNGEGGW